MKGRQVVEEFKGMKTDILVITETKKEIRMEDLGDVCIAEVNLKGRIE